MKVLGGAFHVADDFAHHVAHGFVRQAVGHADNGVERRADLVAGAGEKVRLGLGEVLSLGQIGAVLHVLGDVHDEGERLGELAVGSAQELADGALPHQAVIFGLDAVGDVEWRDAVDDVLPLRADPQHVVAVDDREQPIAFDGVALLARQARHDAVAVGVGAGREIQRPVARIRPAHGGVEHHAVGRDVGHVAQAGHHRAVAGKVGGDTQRAPVRRGGECGETARLTRLGHGLDHARQLRQVERARAFRIAQSQIVQNALERAADHAGFGVAADDLAHPAARLADCSAVVTHDKGDLLRADHALQRRVACLSRRRFARRPCQTKHVHSPPRLAAG